MIYDSRRDWLDARRKRVLVFGMSGLGKTRVSTLLRASGDWYHYSVDYRIGTRYMGEHIVDNFKRQAMRVPFLRDLLLSDSIFIGSNITFDNLSPLSTYLGKPGDPEKGGLPMEEYLRRQEQHGEAEKAAVLDTTRFIDRARNIYGYPHFVCDSSGSICEVVDPDDPEDPLLKALAGHVLMVWIAGSEAHAEELVRRFDAAPKPMYYQPEFLGDAWKTYLSETGVRETEVDPDEFVRWTYARALAHRHPRYAAIARNWGVRVAADRIAGLRDAGDFRELIASALPP